jgi:hypothetical protein
MIELKYSGRFGNQLFQYAIGRVVSKEKRQYLFVDSNSTSPEFKNFDLNLHEEKYSAIIEQNPIVIGGFKIDYNQILNHNGKVILYGYFQDYENILPYKDYIKFLYQFEKNKNLYDDELIAVHIRLTDYLDFQNSLDFDYYIDVIKDSGKQPVIYTDDPKHEYILNIQNEFNCRVVSNTCWQDFVELSSYKHICISQSSYSWWAAWLSNAEVIYYPLSSKKYWQHRGDGNDINLIVTDESRYIYV